MADDAPPAKIGDAALKAKAAAIFEASIQRYRALERYQHDATFNIHTAYLDGNGAEKDTSDQDSKMRVVMDRPNRFRIDSDQLTICSDGEKLRMLPARSSKYLELKAPAGLIPPDELTMILAGASVGLAPELRGMDRSGRNVWDLFPCIRTIESVDRVSIDGVACDRVELMADVDGKGLIPTKVLIDAETKLLRRVSMDYTARYRRMRGRPAVGDAMVFDRFIVSMRYDDVKLDPKLADDAFSLDIPKDAQKYDDVMTLVSGGNPALVGKPAPDFVSTDFADKSIKLADFRGKVVVLDFWATWCGPCVRAMPFVQKASERLKDKPVVFLGINRDKAGGEQRVMAFLESRKITFRQVKDFDGRIAGAYGVTGIPCTVVIDAGGVIRAMDLGYKGGDEDELVQRISAVLDADSAGRSAEDAPPESASDGAGSSAP
ncbi:MAG TPA: redoxin domain-containing protein [Phycisphaerae bacterium]|nr:redoxin domain-containing protein [Phycisphaerae bacterium]HRW52462.1 redoxin domain-containing protein [Phycisphaerae bacterium]